MLYPKSECAQADARNKRISALSATIAVCIFPYLNTDTQMAVVSNYG